MTDRISKRRGGHRAECSKIIKFISDLPIPDPISQQNLNELRKLKTELCRQRDVILTMDDKMLDEIEVDKIDDDIAQSSLVQMRIQEALTAVDATLLKSVEIKPANESTVRNVKLPIITLPKFSGAVLDWQHFWDLHDSTINSRADISDAFKFHYLLSQLTGDEAQLMSGFGHTAAEYVEAINLLKSTYGNISRLIEAYIHAILDMNTCKPTAKDVGKFRSLYEGHVRCLKSLGADVEAAGFVIAAVSIRSYLQKFAIISKEKTNLIFGICKNFVMRLKMKSDLPSVEVTTSLDDDDDDSLLVTSEISKPCTATLSVATKSNSFAMCRLCGDENHSAVSCRKYATIDDRRERVMKERLCFNCLTPKSHHANDCKSKSRCKDCGRKHHSALCNTQKYQESSGKSYNGNSRKLQQNVGAVGTDETSSKNENKNDVVITSTLSSSTSLSKTTNSSTVLPTAYLSVKTGNIVSGVRALFDLGSQKSFILRSVVQKYQCQLCQQFDFLFVDLLVKLNLKYTM